MTPEFRNALYSYEWSENEAGSITSELIMLFASLQTSELRSVETRRLTKSFGWDDSQAFEQHDVQELCRILLDEVQKDFVAMSANLAQFTAHH